MSIFDKFFQKNNNTKTSDQSGNCIIFSLNPEMNNEPYIKIKIDDTSIGASAKFAELLYDIFTGIYNESTVNLMMKMSNEGSDIKQFMHSCIMNWSLLAKNKDTINETNDQNKYYDDDDTPVITPTYFNKNAK